MQHAIHRAGRLPVVALLALVFAGVAAGRGAPAAAQKVVAAGSNYFGQCNVATWRDVTTIAASVHITLGLKADGTVVAAGDLWSASVSAWRDIAAVTVGNIFVAGLKRDGTVVVSPPGAGGNPSGWRGIAAIAAGGGYTVGLRKDGTVVAVGVNRQGECNVSSWRSITAIATGGSEHTVGLKADGTVVATGWNHSGQCNVSGWTGIVAIAAGPSHTVGLKADGTVVATGWNEYGPCDVGDWRGITAIAAGNQYTMGLKADGTLVMAGYTTNGERDALGWRGVTAIACGWSHIVGLTAPATRLGFTAPPEGALVSRSIRPAVKVALQDRYGNVFDTPGSITLSLGANPTGATLAGGLTRTLVNGTATFTDVRIDKVGSGYTLVARADGFASATSSPFNVTLPPARLAFTVQPAGGTALQPMQPAVKVAILDASGHQVDAGANPITLALGANPGGATLSGVRTVAALNGVATFPGLKIDQHGAGYRLLATSPGLAATTSATFTIAAGEQCVVATGSNGQGECNVSGWSDIVGIAAGVRHSVGLKGNGTLAMAGALPVDRTLMAGWTGIVQVAAGESHYVGLRWDGSVVAVAAYGDIPEVSGWSGVTAVAAGSGHIVGLRSDGTVLATGGNSQHQCDVSGWSDIVAVAAGGEHTLGLRSDGTVLAAGDNVWGECNVSGWQDIVAVATSHEHTVGLKRDGTVVAVGDDSHGRCQVSTWQHVTAISIGTVVTAGLKGNGTVLMAGWNNYGQSNVSGWRGIVAIAAGGGHVLGLKMLVPPSHLLFTPQPTAGVAGQAVLPTIRVALRDRFGDIPHLTNAVTLSLGAHPDGARLSGTLTVAAVDGVATFSDLRISRAGKGYTLVATSPGLSSAVSKPFDLSGPPVRLAFTAQPETAVAGALLWPVRVSIEDASGEVVPTASGSVTVVIAAGPAGGVLWGSVTTPAIGSVATFTTLRITKAGTYYLRATSPGLAGGVSPPITIAAGPPARMAFTRHPGRTPSGIPLAPVQVSFRDALGNLCPSATGSVALSLNPAGTPLTGTSTALAVRGVATFTGLSIPKAGAGYTLTAASPGMAAATSSAFEITAGPPARLAFVTQPSGCRAGWVILPAPRVAVQDRMGNTCAATSNSVTITLTGAMAGILSGTTARRATGGLALFNDLAVSPREGASGTCRLLALSPGLAGVLSEPFTVTGSPAPAP